MITGGREDLPDEKDACGRPVPWNRLGDDIHDEANDSGLLLLAARGVGLMAVAATFAYTPSVSATIHPIVESVDCANDAANAHHPLGDVADPPGQTPGYGSHSDRSSLAALRPTSDGFTDLSSPAWFGHKLDGTGGRASP